MAAGFREGFLAAEGFRIRCMEAGEMAGFGALYLVA